MVKGNTIGARSEWVLAQMGDAYQLLERWIIAVTIAHKQRTGEALKPDTPFSPEDERVARMIMRDVEPPHVA